jgi:hypothetical protein
MNQSKMTKVTENAEKKVEIVKKRKGKESTSGSGRISFQIVCLLFFLLFVGQLLNQKLKVKVKEGETSQTRREEGR